MLYLGQYKTELYSIIKIMRMIYNGGSNKNRISHIKNT